MFFPPNTNQSQVEVGFSASWICSPSHAPLTKVSLATSLFCFKKEGSNGKATTRLSISSSYQISCDETEPFSVFFLCVLKNTEGFLSLSCIDLISLMETQQSPEVVRITIRHVYHTSIKLF